MLLQVHQETQNAEHAAARQLWHDEGWVFAKPDGRPLNPNTDYHEGKALLKEAGLRNARLHDARHTAAAVLLILAVPTLKQWPSRAGPVRPWLPRYQHVLDTIRKDVAKQVGGLLWTAREPVLSSADDEESSGK